MVSTVDASMDHIWWIAAGPFNIGWQEIVLIFLIIAVLSVPGLIALGIVLLVLRHQRKKRATSPPSARPTASSGRTSITARCQALLAK
jgi:hypothetical protein